MKNQIVPVSLALALAVLVPAGNVEALPAAQAVETGKVFDQVVTILHTHGLNFNVKDAQRAAIDAVVRSADPGGRVITKPDLDLMEREQAGQFYALGIGLTMTNGSPRVAGLEEGSPAQAAGLAEGDILVAIDGKDLAPIDLGATRELLRGSEQKTLRLDVLKPSGKTNSLSITQALLELPGIETAEILPTGICYIRLNGLYPGTADRVSYFLDDWRATQKFGLIFDLRGANGRDVEGAAKISSLFSEKGLMLFTFRDSDDQDIKVYKADAEAPLGTPTMVLIDGKTTGASEILAASLKRSIRGAMLLGAVTGGDPCIREAIPFEGDQLFYMATRRLVTADGTIYAGREGVKPDVVVTPRAQQPEETYSQPLPMIGKRERLEDEIEDMLLASRVKGDACLRRGVDILLGLKALNIRGFQNSPDS
jgi:carboxyl-terminal processing protease